MPAPPRPGQPADAGDHIVRGESGRLVDDHKSAALRRRHKSAALRRRYISPALRPGRAFRHLLRRTRRDAIWIGVPRRNRAGRDLVHCRVSLARFREQFVNVLHVVEHAVEHEREGRCEPD